MRIDFYLGSQASRVQGRDVCRLGRLYSSTTIAAVALALPLHKVKEWYQIPFGSGGAEGRVSVNGRSQGNGNLNMKANPLTFSHRYLPLLITVCASSYTQRIPVKNGRNNACPDVIILRHKGCLASEAAARFRKQRSSCCSCWCLR